MITGLYTAVAALFIVALARSVIKRRWHYKISSGDGGHLDLIAAIRAHGNPVEYLPIGLLLLLLLELSQNSVWLLHILGIVFILGRLIHAHGITKAILSQRIRGMQITIGSLIIMAGLILLSFAGFQLPV